MAAVAAVCALRELLQWRKFAGLYQGCQLRSAEHALVHMKARLRALEAFEKLGNWGQMCAHAQAVVRAEHRLAVRLWEIKAKAMEPEESAFEVMFRVGNVVHVIVAHPSIDEQTSRRALALEMLQIREKDNGKLDIESDGRCGLTMGALTIGGTVVVHNDCAIVWGSCRGCQAGAPVRDEGVPCLHLFEPAKRQWETVNQHRSLLLRLVLLQLVLAGSHTAVVYKDNMYVFGGDSVMSSKDLRTAERVYHDDIWQLNLKTHRWRCLLPDSRGPTQGKRPVARNAHGAFVHGSYMYIFGGICVDEVQAAMLPAMHNINPMMYQRRMLGDLWRFHLTEHTWEPVFTCGNMPTPRCEFGLVQPEPDRVVIFGGMAHNACGIFLLGDMFELSVTQRWWRQVVPDTAKQGRVRAMPVWPAGSASAMIAALPSGRLLIARLKHIPGPSGMTTLCRSTLAATLKLKDAPGNQREAAPYPRLPEGFDSHTTFRMSPDPRPVRGATVIGVVESRDPRSKCVAALLTLQSVVDLALSTDVAVPMKGAGALVRSQDPSNISIPVHECMKRVRPSDFAREVPFLPAGDPAFALSSGHLPGEAWWGAAAAVPTQIGWELLCTPAMVHQVVRYFGTVKAAQRHFGEVKARSFAKSGSWIYPGYVETGHGESKQDGSRLDSYMAQTCAVQGAPEIDFTELMVMHHSFAEPGAACGGTGVAVDPHRGITFVTVLLVAARCFLRLHFSFRGSPDELSSQTEMLVHSAVSLAVEHRAAVVCEACCDGELLPLEQHPRAQHIKVCGGCGMVSSPSRPLPTAEQDDDTQIDID
ncbi:hypothetical protein WJX81_004094 [Elliptochloris bilobata]|uniref:Uncharacterized protein n=1 Tax=Elliptochloris bilobata TaxID=381761 RepID=A0AAW1QWI0_9CHLO